MNLDRAIDPAKPCEEILAKVAAKPWSQLLAAHLAEHRAMFDRVSLQLGEPDPAAELATDARLDAVRKGGDDPGLIALHFQFGRYLLMGSSRRPGASARESPGHLERQNVGPWESDYHLNINSR